MVWIFEINAKIIVEVDSFPLAAAANQIKHSPSNAFYPIACRDDDSTYVTGMCLLAERRE